MILDGCFRPVEHPYSGKKFVNEVQPAGLEIKTVKR